MVDITKDIRSVTLSAPQSFGEAALLGRETRAASVLTTNDGCRTMCISADDYEQVLSGVPIFFTLSQTCWCVLTANAIRAHGR